MRTQILLVVSGLLPLIAASGCHGTTGGVVYSPIPPSLVDSLIVIDHGRALSVAFPGTYQELGTPGLNRGAGRFTLDEDLIDRIDQELPRQYVGAVMRLAHETLYTSPERVWSRPLSRLEELEYEEEALRNARRWTRRLPLLHRQYIGFTTYSGERVVLIQLLDFGRSPEKYRDYVRERWIFGWHGWFETNVSALEYDVTKNRLNVMGWSHL